MKTSIICFATIFVFHFASNAQTCSQVNVKVSDSKTYSNPLSGFALPLNSSWDVQFENQRAILVAMSDNLQMASMSILKNRNGYTISSAHALGKDLTSKFIQGMGANATLIESKDVYIKNLKSKLVRYQYEIRNLGDVYPMSGTAYFLVKGNYTFVFMLNCTRSMKSCYFEFFENVMKQAFFDQEWY